MMQIYEPNANLRIANIRNSHYSHEIRILASLIREEVEE